MPHVCTPPLYVSYTPIHSNAPRGVHTPHMSPILLCASVCSWRSLHVVGVVRGSLLC